MQNLSCENEFYLHVNGNSFSYERLCTKTRFEKEVQGNSERAYFTLLETIHWIPIQIHARGVSLG